MTKELFITVSAGKCVNRVQLDKFIETHPDGVHLLKSTRKDKRSNLQNAYYWACVVPMVKEGLRDAGYDDVRTNEDAHEIMKHLFLKIQIINKKTGEFFETSNSTTKLNKAQFSEFLESVWKWASEYLNVVIPSPNEQVKMFA